MTVCLGLLLGGESIIIVGVWALSPGVVIVGAQLAVTGLVGVMGVFTYVGLRLLYA